jgi:queuine tRNA-ribosyltransferase
MFEILEATLDYLPQDRPRYLMGVGNPEGIRTAIRMGVDMFDSAMPTRIARNGTAFVSQGRVNILNARYAQDDEALDSDCTCYTCLRYSRAYLRHLYQTGETLALRLLTWHNLFFIFNLIENTKDEIKEV